MPELASENEPAWRYVGKNSKGVPKFRKDTNQTLDHVVEYLDKRGVTYLTKPEAYVVFIYKDKEPKSQYSSRYSYYYTTGRWGDDKRRKHYHSNGIEHFMENYYTTAEESRAKWKQKEQKEKENDSF